MRPLKPQLMLPQNSISFSMGGMFKACLYFQASDLKRHENNMHSERKQLNPLQSDTETLQAAAMAAEEQHLDSISCS